MKCHILILYLSIYLVRIWFLKEYPKLPPLCYVAPTKDMEISVSPFVDHSGYYSDGIMKIDIFKQNWIVHFWIYGF